MYVRNYELGFVEPVTAAITGIATLKNLFGFGKKKAARKQNVAQNKGLYTSAFPPGTNFDSTLDNTPALSGLGRRKGATTLREDYDAMFKHKDSWLVKNGVASPEDYAAYTVMEEIDKGTLNVCDPTNRNPNSKKYQRCPTLNGENVFVAMARGKGGSGGQPAPQPVKPKPPAPTAAKAEPDFIDKLAAKLQEQGVSPTQFMPGGPTVTPQPQVVVQAPAPASQSQQASGAPSWMWWAIPAGAVAAGALIYAMTPQRRRSRRR